MKVFVVMVIATLAVVFGVAIFRGHNHGHKKPNIGGLTIAQLAEVEQLQKKMDQKLNYDPKIQNDWNKILNFRISNHPKIFSIAGYWDDFRYRRVNDPKKMGHAPYSVLVYVPNLEEYTVLRYSSNKSAIYRVVISKKMLWKELWVRDVTVKGHPWRKLKVREGIFYQDFLPILIPNSSD